MSRLIIVPAAAPRELDHDHGLDVGGIEIKTKPSRTPSFEVLDPMNDFAALYLPVSVNTEWEFVDLCVTIHRHEFHPFYFDTINAWVEEHCFDPVLIQRIDGARPAGSKSISNTSFRLLFCDGMIRRNEFQLWWAVQPTSRRQFIIPNTVTAFELFDWLKENTISARYFRSSNNSHLIITTDERDAVAIKLRWFDSMRELVSP